MTSSDEAVRAAAERDQWRANARDSIGYTRELVDLYEAEGFTRSEAITLATGYVQAMWTPRTSPEAIGAVFREIMRGDAGDE